MRKPLIVVLMLLIGGFLFTDVAPAQDFSKTTIQKNYQTLNALNRTDDFDDQIEAIVKLFGALVGSGAVNTASLHHVGGFDVGARAVIGDIPEEFKDIAGDVPNVTNPLSGANTIPFPFLHASVGLPGNLELMGKFFTVSIADKPNSNVTLIGGAVKYGLLRGTMATPAITLLGGYQTLLVPDEYAFGNVSTFSLKVYISKGFVIATVYAGGGIERTSLKLDIPGFPDLNKDYNVTYPNGTVGLTITPFPLVKVNADYNFGEVKNISVGVGVSIR